jgi:hypothetical protein
MITIIHDQQRDSFDGMIRKANLYLRVVDAAGIQQPWQTPAKKCPNQAEWIRVPPMSPATTD